jgi:hypothetical protein
MKSPLGGEREANRRDRERKKEGARPLPPGGWGTPKVLEDIPSRMHK